MSHYTVLVPASNDADLRKKLQPFHEYECTGIEDQYVVWVDKHDEVVSAYEESDQDDDIEAFAERYFGYDLDDETQRFGRYTNPNAKWDWWVIGGRWSGTLKLIDNRQALNAFAGVGEGGAFNDPTSDPIRADIAENQHIDWHAMRTEAAKRRFDWRLEWQKICDKHPHFYVSDRLRNRFANAAKDNAPQLSIYQYVCELWIREYYENDYRGEQRRDIFPSAEAYRLFKFREQFAKPHYWWSWDDLRELQMSPSVLFELHYDKPITYAFIDLDGNWNAKGEMGWFGVSSNESPDQYESRFWAFVESLEPNQRLYVVDCHI